MSNHLVPAAAEGMPAVRTRIDELLVSYLDAVREVHLLRNASEAAEATLPEWAKAGPKYLNSDGSFSGPIVNWPRRDPLPEPPEGAGVYRSVRPSLRDVWKGRTLLLGTGSYSIQNDDGTVTHVPASPKYLEHRRKTRLAAFDAVRKVIARVREQREEERKAGIDGLHEAWSRASARRFSLVDEIKACALGVTIEEIAAAILIDEFGYGAPTRPLPDDENISIILLGRLAPHLTGVLRIVVDDILQDLDRPFGETLMGGRLDTSVLDLAARARIEGIAA